MSNWIFVDPTIATSKVLRIDEVCYTKCRPAVEMPTVTSGEPLANCYDCLDSSSSSSESSGSSDVSLSSWSSTPSESSYSSQSSDSSGQPPGSSDSSSSSSSSSESSSEELHTCHRCGNCCYSDKSYQTRDFKPVLAGGSASQPVVDFYNSLPNYQIPNVGGCFLYRIELPPAYISQLISDGVLVEGETVFIEDGGAGQIIALVYDEFGTQTSGWWLWEHWSSIVVTNNCCETVMSNWTDFTVNDPSSPEATHEVEMTYQVHNNPCCRDPFGTGDQCAQHFNGDCRGNCDDDSTSSGTGSESSSSEENPLP